MKSRLNIGADDVVDIFNRAIGIAESTDGTRYKVRGSADFTVDADGELSDLPENFVRFSSEVVRDSVIVEEPRGYGRVAVQGQVGDTEFLRNPLDTDSEPIETTAALRAVLEEAGVVVDESTPKQIAGIDGEVFDIAGSRSADFVLQVFDDAPNGWYAPPKGRMWSIEHPERGLLVMTAWAWEDFDTVYPEVVRQAESLIGSLEFIE